MTVENKVLNTKKDGYTFGGWYTDEACTTENEFDFDDAIHSDITIDAKWVPVTGGDDTAKNDDESIKSPQTGDNSNLWLWFDLLVVSGGAVVILTVADKKKKVVKR